MEEHDKTSNTGTNPAKPGDTGQIQQIRQNMIQQIAEIKRQISVIQQQALKTMQDSVDSIFKAETSENLQEIARQEKNAMHQMEEAIQHAGQEASGAMHNYTESADYNNIQQFDAGRQAMESAGKSVEQAMQSAMKSVESAESTITSLNKH